MGGVLPPKDAFENKPTIIYVTKINMNQEEIETLIAEYLKAYVSLEAAKGNLASATSELAKKGKALCKELAEASCGEPIVINSPIGWITLTLDEDYWDGKDTVDFWANRAVKVVHLTTLPDLMEKVEWQHGIFGKNNSRPMMPQEDKEENDQ